MRSLSVVGVLLLCACETDEVRQWQKTRDELLKQKAALVALAANPAAADAELQAFTALQASLDLAGFVRAHALKAQVFQDAGGTRVVVSGTVEACGEALAGLAPVRGVLSQWRLRLDGGRCEWEGRAGPEAARIEAALQAPPTARWSVPPKELLSKNVEALQAEVDRLTVEIAELERRLGDRWRAAGARRALEGVKADVAALEAVAAPCDRAIVERELTLDAPDRGKLLEIQHDRLVDPLEPKTDVRLRSILDVVDGKLSWHCEAK